MSSTDASLYICKIFISSRDSLEISRTLGRKNKSTVTISLGDSDEGVAINRSIGQFVDARLSDLPNHFNELDPSTLVLAHVKRALLDKSNGMFLWVRLVLDSLETIYSPEELREIVDDLPSDLEALYRRIFDRLCNARGPHNYGGVPRIMSWICFARRPLHKHELLHGLAIPPTDSEFNAQSVPLAQILDHCKPFVEERSDSTVVLVHFSVKEFFLKSKAPQIVSPLQAQLDISSACAATLMRGLDLLRPVATPSYNMVQIASGSYRLLPYALESWIEHCLLYVSTGGPLTLDHIFLCRLTRLCNKHDQLSQELDINETEDSSSFEVSENKLDDRLKLLAHISIHNLMRGVLYARLSASQHFCENGEDVEAFTTQNDRTLFSRLTTKFDSDVIYLLSQNEVAGVPKVTLEAFQKSYASSAFRCLYPYCPKSSAGFASQQLRIQHEAGHFHRVYCKIVSCQWSRIGFEKKSGLDSHTRKYHNERFTFPIPPKIRHILEDRAIDREASAKVEGDNDDLFEFEQLDRQQDQQPPLQFDDSVSVQQYIIQHYRSQQQKAPPGWQQSLPPDERASLVMQFLTCYRLLKPEVSEQEIVRGSVQFETQTFVDSPTKDQYVSQIKSRLQNMQRLRQQRARTVQNNLSNPMNPAQMGTIGQPGIQGQRQNPQQQFPQGFPSPQLQRPTQASPIPMSQGGSSMGMNAMQLQQGQNGQQQPQQQQPEIDNALIMRLTQKLMKDVGDEVKQKFQQDVASWSVERRQQLMNQNIDPLMFRFRQHAEMMLINRSTNAAQLQGPQAGSQIGGPMQ